jgi:serine/threonine protein phosphatase PrpC
MEFIKKIFSSGRQHLEAFASSDIGGFRKENQDNFLILKPEETQNSAYLLIDERYQEMESPDWPATHIRVAVADGMGGHTNGREISEAAVKELMQIPPQTSPESMRDAVLNLHKSLQSRFSSGERSPGTTLVLADVERKTGKGVLLNLGDSRAFLLRKNEWRQITRDHNASEFSWRDGELSREDYEARLGLPDHRIVQALGYGSIGIIRAKDGYKPFRFDPGIRLDLKNHLRPDLSQHADVFPFRLSAGDLLMLASDGLWRADPEDLWRSIPAEELFSQEGLDKLVKNAAKQPSADDNITVVLCGG